jgi:hypothetical protein
MKKDKIFANLVGDGSAPSPQVEEQMREEIAAHLQLSPPVNYLKDPDAALELLNERCQGVFVLPTIEPEGFSTVVGHLDDVFTTAAYPSEALALFAMLHFVVVVSKSQLT